MNLKEKVNLIYCKLLKPYGVSDWVEHPEGWRYKVIYLSKSKVLSYSLLYEVDMFGSKLK